MAVRDDDGELIEETRVRNEDLEAIAEQYAGGEALLEATTNYFYIYDLLSEHLDVCENCETVSNADVNGAENLRQKVLPSLATDGGDRDNGWLAQPAVHLFDRSEGVFAPREQVENREP